ncbi:MAG: tetratricopeptide repeat protein [Muribaculaceae bacterium]|nr:tetratricopeptide repeat protein [Muribaculaceae bacterium]
MKSKIICLVICLISSGFSRAYANDLSEADSAYNAKEYTKAIQIYENIAQEKGTNAPLLYNLGNAYFQEGDYGNAMVSYLRAYKLDPTNKEINANLQYLRSRVDDANKAEQKGKRLRVAPDEQSFFQSVKTSVAIRTSSNVWAGWGAVCFIIFVGGVAIYIFSRSVLIKKIGFFGGFVSLLFAIVFICFSFMGARAFNSRDEGVLTAFKTTLLTEPGKDSEEGKGNILTKGTVVQILSEETDAEGNVIWYKVRLNSDYIGWVDAESLIVV